MKKSIKIIATILVIMLVILIEKTSYAATGSMKMTLTAKSTQNTDNKVLVSISLTDFANIVTTNTTAITGTLTYDTSLFEIPTIEGKNGSAVKLNTENGKLVLDANSVKENQEIAVITFKVKAGLTADKSTTFKISSVEISDNNELDITNATFTSNSVTITKNAQDITTNTTNTTTNTTANETTNTTTSTTTNATTNTTTNVTINTTNTTVNETTNTTSSTATQNIPVQKVNTIDPVTDKTVSGKDIPQTGANTAMIVSVILGAIVIGVLAFIRYKTYFD